MAVHNLMQGSCESRKCDVAGLCKLGVSCEGTVYVKMQGSCEGRECDVTETGCRVSCEGSPCSDKMQL